MNAPGDPQETPQTSPGRGQGKAVEEAWKEGVPLLTAHVLPA